MRIRKLLAVALLLQCSFACVGQNNPKPALYTGTRQLTALRNDLKSGKVERLEIVYYDEMIKTVTAVTPERLESLRKRTSFPVADNPARVQNLLRAIQKTRFTKWEQGSEDYRFACIFYDRSGRRSHTVYLAGAWKGKATCILDGAWVMAQGGLPDWIMATARNENKRRPRQTLDHWRATHPPRT